VKTKAARTERGPASFRPFGRPASATPAELFAPQVDYTGITLRPELETDDARGDKSSYTDKQKRKAEHIEEGYEDRGVPNGEVERRAWATPTRYRGGGNR